jgi:ketosteroid isomerase-like protein
LRISQSEIAPVNRQFEDAARNRDLDWLASLYTPDAIALQPDGAIIKGRDSIKQMWGSLAQQVGLKDVRLDTLDFEQAGDTGYEVGEATLTLSSGAAVVKFVVVWKKVGGQWRLHRDIWNTKGA